ncbi:MAG: S-layer homology domain-containing protein, partial [Defluviitaleaceae bacterium]|nr:S-layer homology domain-containing protein [Defluviitaleaceae bacterium]
VVGGPTDRDTITVELGSGTIVTLVRENSVWTLRDGDMMLGLVTARANGWIPASDTVTADNYDGGRTAIVALTLTMVPVDANYGTISGRVLESAAGNAPIVGATVTLITADGTIAGVTETSADGFYFFENLTPGAYSVFAGATGFNVGYYTGNAVAVAAGELLSDVDIYLQTGTLSFALLATVVTADGSPLPADVNVVVVESEVLNRINDSNIWKLASDEPLTDEYAKAGAWRHHSYRARIGNHSALSGIANVTLTLVPFGEYTGIFGQVTGGDDTPIVDATILIQNAAGSIAATLVTDAFGNYLAIGLDAGSYTVIVVAAGYVSQSRATTVTSNEMAEENFRLTAGGTAGDYILLVTVTGAPANEVTVSMSGTTFNRIETTNVWEARGNSEFTGGTVTASAPDYLPNIGTVGTHNAQGIAFVSIALELEPLPDMVTIIFNSNGGRPGLQNATVTIGDTYAAAFNLVVEPTRDNDIFLGWFTQSSGGEQVIPGTVVTLTDNHSLFAQWQLGAPDPGPDVVTITFNANGGQPATQTATVTVGSTYSSAFNLVDEPARGEDIFLGWFTQSAGGTQVMPNTAVTRTDSHMLFAQWESRTAEQPSQPEQPGGQRPTPDPGTPYRPVPPALGYAYEAIDHIRDILGYTEYFNERFVTGFPDGTFRPMSSITRAEAAALLVRTTLDTFSYDAPIPNIDGVFSDVSQGDWFYRYVAWAYAHGLVTGYPDGTFKPNNPITREEFAAMIARGSTVVTGNAPFADAGQVGDWARNFVNTVFRAGWMVGDEHGRFNPTANITRAEAVATISRRIGRNRTITASLANVQEDVRTFSDVTNRSAWFYYYVVDAGNSYRYSNIGYTKIWTRVEE